MIYAATITTPSDTAEASSQETVIKVTKGLLWRVEIEFPPGCAGLLHVAIFDGSYQVVPASPGETIHSDAALIGFDDLYMKASEPFTFQVVTYNLDDTYDHTIQVRLAMASSEAFMSRYLPSMQWDNFRKLMSEIYTDQQQRRNEQLRQGFNQLNIGRDGTRQT